MRNNWRVEKKVKILTHLYRLSCCQLMLYCPWRQLKQAFVNHTFSMLILESSFIVSLFVEAVSLYGGPVSAGFVINSSMNYPPTSPAHCPLLLLLTSPPKKKKKPRGSNFAAFTFYNRPTWQR